jgi:DNA-binding beta-propeller fold protein YncE
MKIASSLVLVGVLAASPALAAEPSKLELVQTIVLKGKAGKLDHLTLDPKRDRLFLANTVNGTLDVVDLKSGKLLKQVSGQSGIQGVAYAPELDRVFVGLGTGGYCNAFDGENFKLLKTVKFADDADNVRFDPATKQVFVAHAEKLLGVVDADSYAVKADIPLPGGGEGFIMESARPRLYMSIPSPSVLLVIDTQQRSILATYPIKMAGGGHPVALDEANKRVFIGCRTEPMVVVVDTETGKEITSVPIPKDVDDLFFDAKRKRLYASCGEGSVAVIRQNDADHYEMLEKVPTTEKAKTSYFHADSNRLFVAVPRQAGKEGPEIRVYRVRD